MSYILARERDQDVSKAFRNYERYLAENAARFPPSAYALATSNWYYDPSDHRCPHDAWLESATLLEPSSGLRREIRSTSLTLRLLGAYHDGHIEISYAEVFAYQLDMHRVTQGHGDWRYDEFRVTEHGRLLHEIEWAHARDTGRWVIEASDIHFKWVPYAA
jgi:hypothetical protein